MLQTIIDDIKIVIEKTGDNNSYRHHQVANVMAYITKQAETGSSIANEEEEAEVVPSTIMKQETNYLLRSCATCKSTACKMGCPKHPCVIREVLELL